MKYIFINNNNISIETKGIRKIEKNEVLVKVKFVGLCGSDMHKINDVNFKQNIILGHEIVGEIIDSSDLDLIGLNVVVDPIIPCGKCYYCERNQTQLCLNIIAIGRNIDGGFAEFLIVPKINIHGLGEDFNLKLGTLVDGAAVVFHGLNILKEYSLPYRNIKIAIIGDGTIGALVGTIFSDYTKDITIFTKNNELYIEKMGFKHISFLDIGDIEDDLYDLTIECVGGQQSETLNSAFRITKRKGAILVFGVFGVDYFSSVFVRNLFYKEIVLLGVNSYGNYQNISDFETAMLHISNNQDKYKKIIINEYPFYNFCVGLSQENHLKTIFYF